MNWTTLEFDQLSPRELYLIMRARSAVFVVEAARVHLDADGHDEAALHVLAHEDITRPMPICAYARIRPGESEYQEVVIDKILTSPAHRGDGTAEVLFAHVLRLVDARWPGHRVTALAPCAERARYRRFGFREAGGAGSGCEPPCVAFVRHGPADGGTPAGRRDARVDRYAMGPFGMR
jgi:ElaA protein